MSVVPARLRVLQRGTGTDVLNDDDFIQMSVVYESWRTARQAMQRAHVTREAAQAARERARAVRARSTLLMATRNGDPNRIRRS